MTINGILYPARVTYSHLNGNFHEVLFFYEDRPDVFDDYRPTFSVQTDKRLRRIFGLARADGLLDACQPLRVAN